MKSFLLSAVLTVVAFVYTTQSFSRHNAFYKTAPPWVVLMPLAVILLGYLLALYWGVTGILHKQRLLNSLGIALSVLGLGYYWLGYRLGAGGGEEAKGQFDHHIAAVAPDQREVLYQLMKETGTPPSQLKMVPYWKMEKDSGSFVVCVQKGAVIGLQIKSKPLTGLTPLCRLKSLTWLVLQDCGLKSLSGLDLPALQRLNVTGNELTTLAGIEAFPQLGWLSYGGNPVKDSTALEAVANKNLSVINY